MLDDDDSDVEASVVMIWDETSKNCFLGLRTKV